jgi:hypothetical protein
MAASLMICNLRSTAATAMGLVRNASKSMPDVNCPIIAIASMMSANERCGGGLRDENRLALRFFKHLRPQHLSVEKVRLNAEDIRKTVFEMDSADERQLPCTVESAMAATSDASRIAVPRA